MSGLLNNPNLKKQPKTDPLDRGQDIKPKNTFTTDDLKSNNGKPSKPGKSVADSVTFYANVRINNHIKNKAEALSGIGLYKSQKDAIDNALDYLIDSLDAEDKRKFTFQLDIKYLIAVLDSGSRLVLHLRMTGRLTALPSGLPLEKHTSLQIHLDGDLELRLVDQRKFATLHLLHESGYGAIKGLATMGVEPLDSGFTPEYLKAQLEGRTASVKSVILDQRRIGGLGNIYADESLYRAGIFPGKPGGSLTFDEIQRLHTSIRAVIREGIRFRGTTFRDYVDGDGKSGGFQERLQVYGKEGETCRGCGRPIARIKLAGRSSYYCAYCQV